MVGEGNLLACLVEWGGSNVGPGELIRDSQGGYVVGELDGDGHRARAPLAAALQPVGTTRVTDNVRGMIWTKLLVNSTFTGLSAVSGLRYGGVAEQGPDAVFALWEEGVAVADAQGLELERDPRRRPRRVRRRKALAHDDASTWQRPALDAAGPRRGPRHRGRRRQRRRRRARAASSASRRRATTRWSSSCTRWSAASALPTRKWLAYVSDAQITSATDS